MATAPTPTNSVTIINQGGGMGLDYTGYPNGGAIGGTGSYDDGAIYIILPWNINYLEFDNTPYISVGTNGYIMFDGNASTRGIQRNIYPPGVGRLDITAEDSTLLELRYAVFGTAPNRTAYIKYTGLLYDGSAYDYRNIWEVAFLENSPSVINVHMISNGWWDAYYADRMEPYPTGVYQWYDTTVPSYPFPNKGYSETGTKITKLNPVSGDVFYEWRLNGTTVSNPYYNDMYGATPPSPYDANRVDTLTLYMRQDSLTGTILAADTITIYSQLIDSNQSNGNLIAWLDNPYVTIPTQADGIVKDFTATKGKISIYKGNTDLTFGPDRSILSASGCTATVDYKGNYQLTSMDSDTATVVFRSVVSMYSLITYTSTVTNVDLTLTVRKSKIGDNSWSFTSNPLYGGNNGYAVRLKINTYFRAYKYETNTYNGQIYPAWAGNAVGARAIKVPLMKVEDVPPTSLNLYAKKFLINATTGTMLIGVENILVGPNNDSYAVTNPTAYARDLYFHSLLNYLQIKSSIAGYNLYYSQIAVTSGSLLTNVFQTIPWGTTSVSSPLLMIRVNGVGYPTGYRIEYTNGYRNFYPIIDSSGNISIECHAVSYNSVLPAVTLATVEVLIAS